MQNNLKLTNFIVITRFHNDLKLVNLFYTLDQFQVIVQSNNKHDIMSYSFMTQHNICNLGQYLCHEVQVQKILSQPDMSLCNPRMRTGYHYRLHNHFKLVNCKLFCTLNQFQVIVQSSSKHDIMASPPQIYDPAYCMQSRPVLMSSDPSSTNVTVHTQTEDVQIFKFFWLTPQFFTIIPQLHL